MTRRVVKIVGDEVRTSDPLCVASQALKRAYPAYKDDSFDKLLAALDHAHKLR